MYSITADVRDSPRVQQVAQMYHPKGAKINPLHQNLALLWLDRYLPYTYTIFNMYRYVFNSSLILFEHTIKHGNMENLFRMCEAPTFGGHRSVEHVEQ